MLGVWIGGSDAMASDVRVAVAANFAAAAKEIALQFETESGHVAMLSFGPSGQLYTQIANGAPFDVFLSADEARPEQAEAEKNAAEGSRFTYAIGRLVLWSRTPGLVDARGEVLRGGTFRRLAIANPKTAPYGAAAVEALRALDVWESVEPKLVQGESVVQVYQFVATGNADIGFISLAQAAASSSGSQWVVPADLHAPIRQQAVLLVRGEENPAAKAFLRFLRGPRGRGIIERYGYEIEAP
jgi:molybdate transport system substrate-binding protein